MSSGTSEKWVLWPAQEKYIDVMKTVIQNNGVGLFQAGTGFGKTLANLIAAIQPNMKSKVYYFSRTHQQSSQVINEAKKLTDVIGCSSIQLAGRDRLCHLSEVYKSPFEIQLCKNKQEIWRKARVSRTPAYACHSLYATRRGKKKITELKAQSVKIPSNAGLDDIIFNSQKNSFCAYYTARDLATIRTLVVGSYLYGLDREIRGALNIDLRNAVIIFDEGHNLEDVCCTILSQEIDLDDIITSLSALNQLKNQFSSIPDRKPLIHTIEELQKMTRTVLSVFKEFTKKFTYETIGTEEITFCKGQVMTNFVQEQGFTDSFGRKHLSLLKEIEDIYEEKPDRLQPLSPIKKIGNSILAIQEPNGFGVIITRDLQKNPKDTGVKIRWECLDPALVISEIKNKAKALIICSGTLEPLDLTAQILGVEEAVCQDFGSTIQSENILIFALGKDAMGNHLSSEYRYRKNNEIYKSYARTINSIKSLLTSGLLCFFPSYSFLSSVVQEGFSGHLPQNVFIEERSSFKNENKLRLFKRAVREGSAAVFCAVVGGKVAEGADLPQELSRGVIVCGIPFLPTRDPVVRLRKDYYNEKKKGLGEQWYLRESIQRAAQALGRGWRGKKDYAVGFLLDSRYLHRRNRQYLPVGFRNRIFVPSTWEEVENKVQEFLQTTNAK